jgi:hypothetical protein
MSSHLRSLISSVCNLDAANSALISAIANTVDISVSVSALDAFNRAVDVYNDEIVVVAEEDAQPGACDACIVATDACVAACDANDDDKSSKSLLRYVIEVVYATVTLAKNNCQCHSIAQSVT